MKQIEPCRAGDSIATEEIHPDVTFPHGIGREVPGPGIARASTSTATATATKGKKYYGTIETH